MHMHNQPIKVLLILIPILVCILLVVFKDKREPNTITIFVKFSIYLLSVLVLINLGFFARAHTGWY